MRSLNPWHFDSDSQRLSAFFELENKLSGERNNSVDIVVSPSPEFALVDKLSRGWFGTLWDCSAFDCVPVSSIRQSKTSAEAHRDPSVTEAATSLSKCYLEQHTFHSRPPAGRHLKIRQISYCAGSYRPADFIFNFCLSRQNLCFVRCLRAM